MSMSWKLALASVAVSLSVAACGAPGSPGSGGDGGDADGPHKVGLVYSKSGPLATYGAQYRAAFDAGIDYATDGTGEVQTRQEATPFPAGATGWHSIAVTVTD